MAPPLRKTNKYAYLRILLTGGTYTRHLTQIVWLRQCPKPKISYVMAHGLLFLKKLTNSQIASITFYATVYRQTNIMQKTEPRPNMTA